MLHRETVADETLDLIREMMNDKAFKDFNLVGGTALSLQIGHRISVDIDFFNPKPFNSSKMSEYLQVKYNAENIRTLKNGVFCFINDIKVDLLSHQYPSIKPIIKEESIRMASLEDIGAMKLNAITDNGTRLKDFVDIYYLLEYHPLEHLLTAYENKYPDVSRHIATKALNYYNDIQPVTIHFASSSITRAQIIRRITEATLEPTKIFKAK